jgi:hypothetical protein
MSSFIHREHGIAIDLSLFGTDAQISEEIDHETIARLAEAVLVIECHIR